MARRIQLVVVLVAVVVVAAVLVRISADDPTVRFAITVDSEAQSDQPTLPATAGWPYSHRLAADWNLDEQFGFEFELVPRVSGRGTMTALLEGNADIAYMAATPLVAAIARGEDILVLAQTERSDRQIRIVVAADHVDDWYEQPIGVIPGTTFEAMLMATLEHTGHADGRAAGLINEFGAENPASLMNMLLDGTVAATIMLQPQAALVTSGQAAGSNDTGFVDVTEPGVYEFGGYMVTTAERWQANRGAILQAMNAVVEARRLIADDPDARLAEIHDFESGETSLRDVRPQFWSQDEIVFETDKETVSDALSTEAELMVRAGIIAAAPDLTETLSILDQVEAAVR